MAHGARFLRLDAIAYLWKEIGTSCIHLPQTHAVVQLMRAILDEIAPGVRLITETNVPHQDNLSYSLDIPAVLVYGCERRLQSVRAKGVMPPDSSTNSPFFAMALRFGAQGGAR